MGEVTYGDVLAGTLEHDELVPFGGAQAHKAFALAVGLQLLVDALARRTSSARCSSSRGRRRIRCRRSASWRAGYGCRVTAST